MWICGRDEEGRRTNKIVVKGGGREGKGVRIEEQRRKC
jgi:hypothetical protein